MSNNRTFKILIGIFLIVVCIFLYHYFRNTNSSEVAVVNNTENTVGTWPSYTDQATGAVFTYPANFGTSDITITDWPPHLQFLNQKYSCRPAGSESVRTGKTSEAKMGDVKYCLTKVVTKQQDKTISQYAYAFPVASDTTKTVIFTFGTTQKSGVPTFIPDPILVEIYKSLK
jgi:hypothetical protein